MFDLVVRGDLVPPRPRAGRRLPRGPGRHDRCARHRRGAGGGGGSRCRGPPDLPRRHRRPGPRRELRGDRGLADASVAAAAGGSPPSSTCPSTTRCRSTRSRCSKPRSRPWSASPWSMSPSTARRRRGAGTEGIAALADAGVCAFKVSTYEYHPVRFPGYDMGELYELFPAIRETGLSVAFHNETPPSSAASPSAFSTSAATRRRATAPAARRSPRWWPMPLSSRSRA